MWWRGLFGLFCVLCSVSIASAQEDEPRIQIKIQLPVFELGTNKGVVCKGYGDIKDKLQWIDPKGNVVGSSRAHRYYADISNNDPYFLLLVINLVRFEDQGNWTCMAGDLMDTMDVVVGEKVKIGQSDETINAHEGQTITLNCDAKGTPPPTVLWYKNNEVLDVFPRNFRQRIDRDKNKYQLEIKNVDYSVTGQYACKLTQKTLSHYDRKNFHVAITHKPILFDAETKEVYLKTSRVDEVYAVLNETKKLVCSAYGNPTNNFLWTRLKNGLETDLTEAQDLIENTQDGTTSIFSLRMYDESYTGEYTCKAKNAHGQAIIHYHVSLGEKPNPPDFVEFIEGNVTELTFNVTCSTCNFEPPDDTRSKDPKNLPVLGYSFNFVPVEEGYTTADWDSANAIEIEEDIHFNDTIYVVGPLPNSTSFFSRVRTRNEAGYSDWVYVEGNPATTDNAIRLTFSFLLICAPFLTVNFY